MTVTFHVIWMLTLILLVLEIVIQLTGIPIYLMIGFYVVTFGISTILMELADVKIEILKTQCDVAKLEGHSLKLFGKIVNLQGERNANSN